MTRKRFIKIMQSKGMQRNEAVTLAKKIRKNKSHGYNYENVSKGSVIIYGGGNHIVLLPNHYVIINIIKVGNKTFRLTKGESK